MTSKAYLM